MSSPKEREASLTFYDDDSTTEPLEDMHEKHMSPEGLSTALFEHPTLPPLIAEDVGFLSPVLGTTSPATPSSSLIELDVGVGCSTQPVAHNDLALFDSTSPTLSTGSSNLVLDCKRR